MEAYLDHIGRVNPLVNAIVSLRDRKALTAEAGERDDELACGKYRGWMHGFPQAIKDLVPTKNIRTTRGSLLYKDHVPDFDAPLVRRVKEAGSIIIGKTNTPEFGLGSHTDNDVFGTTLNAYDQSRSAGGSSGGAAVALALRMLPVADGSDHAGSLRNPAAFNNVFGFRPSARRIVCNDRDSCAPVLGVTGPMGRTVTDLARLFSVQNRHDPLATFWTSVDSIRPAEALRRDFKDTRIAWLGDFGGYLAVEAGVIGLCENAHRVFESIGCHIENARPAYPLQQLWEAWLTLRGWQIGGDLKRHARKPDQAELLRPQARWEIESGFRHSAYDVYDAMVARRAWCEALSKLFDSFDYLLFPAAQAFPFDVAWQWPTEIGGRAMDTYHRWMEVAIPVTMSGCPAISVPVGLNELGLPMGLQIVAPYEADIRCLQLAHAYEHATGWVENTLPSLLSPRILSDEAQSVYLANEWTVIHTPEQLETRSIRR